jgi:isoaspartyl peptidase/L-asparaginase-like protein (Ntn-hydrolase superfamily)
MEKTEHCFLVGQGAQLFARHNGIEIMEATDLLIPRELEFYNQIRNDTAFGPVPRTAGVWPQIDVFHEKGRCPSRPARLC